MSIIGEMKELRERLAELEGKCEKEVADIISKRNALSERLQPLELEIKMIKEEISQIDAELRDNMKAFGMDSEVTYIGGLRMEFKEEVIGKIDIGREEDVLRWSKETGNEEVLKLSVGKTAFNKLLDSGAELPDCFKVDTFTKFNVKKDTRKNK